MADDRLEQKIKQLAEKHKEHDWKRLTVPPWPRENVAAALREAIHWAEQEQRAEVEKLHTLLIKQTARYETAIAHGAKHLQRATEAERQREELREALLDSTSYLEDFVGTDADSEGAIAELVAANTKLLTPPPATAEVSR